jgi:hypothetical protein
VEKKWSWRAREMDVGVPEADNSKSRNEVSETSLPSVILAVAAGGRQFTTSDDVRVEQVG